VLFTAVTYVALLQVKKGDVLKYLAITGNGFMYFMVVLYISVIDGETYTVLCFVATAALVVEGCMMGIPIYCIAYANARVRNIKEFGKTAPHDFAILGPDLVRWINESPVSRFEISCVSLLSDLFMKLQIFWTVLGVPMTPAIVQSYAYSFVAVIPSIILAVSHYASKK
jgi:hypothetical protein